MTIRLLPEYVALFMLVFARVGTMLMLLPGLGEQASPQRIRLSLALFITLMMVPMVEERFRPPIGDLPALVQLLIIEILIGMTLGLSGRFLMSSLQTAGVIISQQMGLSFSMAIDPSGGDRGQSAILGNFLTLLGIGLIFAAGLHHVAIMGILDSYKTLAPGAMPASGDAAELAITIAGSAFATGVQISAPFLVFGLVFNVGLGILSRMMPQLQVFFLALPASILIGTVILILVLPLMMDGFIAHVAKVFGDLFPGSR